MSELAELQLWLHCCSSLKMLYFTWFDASYVVYFYLCFIISFIVFVFIFIPVIIIIIIGHRSRGESLTSRLLCQIKIGCSKYSKQEAGNVKAWSGTDPSLFFGSWLKRCHVHCFLHISHSVKHSGHVFALALQVFTGQRAAHWPTTLFLL